MDIPRMKSADILRREFDVNIAMAWSSLVSAFVKVPVQRLFLQLSYLVLV